MLEKLRCFKVLILSFLIFILNTNLHSQCLNSGGIGSFDSSNFQNSWNFSSNNFGTVEVLTNTNQAYFGDSYIKAQVLENTNSEVNLSNKNNCNFSLISGNPYTISFYLKGIPGKTFKVSLMNGESVIASENDTTKLSEWTYYTFMFSSNVDSSSGSIKIEFQENIDFFI